MPRPLLSGIASAQIPATGFPAGPRTTPAIWPVVGSARSLVVVFPADTVIGPKTRAVRLGASLEHAGSPARTSYLPGARFVARYDPPCSDIAREPDAVLLSGSTSTHVPGAGFEPLARRTLVTPDTDPPRP